MSPAPKGYLLKLDTLPMPPTRQDRVTALGSILESGGVHKVVMEAGKDIRVFRWVKDDLEGLPPEILTDNIMAATRAVEMDDCLADDKPSAMELLFRGFSLVSKRGLKPTSVVVRSVAGLRKWLKIDPLRDTGEVFCVPVVHHNSVPEKVVLLVAANPADPSEVEYSVKLDMEDAK